jgi:hypothetical protein
MDVPAGVSRRAVLPSVSARDVDMTVALSTDAAPTGNGFYAYVVTRETAGGAHYRTRVRTLSDGRVLLGLSVVDGSTSTLAPDAFVAGLTAVPGQPLLVRTRVTGASPTTVQAKIWRAGTTEPSGWQATATDTTAAVQVAGSVGVRGYTSGSATRPVTLLVDDLVVRPSA